MYSNQECANEPSLNKCQVYSGGECPPLLLDGFNEEHFVELLPERLAHAKVDHNVGRRVDYLHKTK